MEDITRSGSLSKDLYIWGQRNSAHSLTSARLGANLFKFDQQLEKTDKNKDLPKELIASRRWINSSFHGMRWIVMVLCGFNVALMLFVRFSISVVIVDMVNQTETQTYRIFNNKTGEYDMETVEEYVFNWDNKIQFFIISVYMVAYGIPQVVLSMIVERKGGHKIGAISQSISLLASLAIPLAAHLGWEYVAVIRVIIGVAHSSIVAIGVRLTEVWIPANEMSTSVTLNQFVSCIGIVLNPIISGYLTAIHWSCSFYWPCVIIAVWLTLWLVIVRDNPEDCWLISQQELKLILNQRNYNKIDGGGDLIIGTEDGRMIKNSWRKVFKLPSLYAFLITWSCANISSTCFIIILPNYLSHIGYVDIAENGTIVFIILSAGLISYLWGLRLLSYLINNNYSMTKARQIVYSISVFVSATAWILPQLIDGDPTWMLLLNRAAHPVAEIIVIGTVMDNFSNIGKSASVFGIINTVAFVLSSPSGLIIGLILDVYGTSPICWNSIFVGFAVLNILALLCFLTFIDSEPVQLNGKNNKPASNLSQLATGSYK